MGKPSCPDCAEYPVIHRFEWFSALFESVFIPALSPLDAIARKVEPALISLKTDKFALPFFKALATVHLGKLKTTPDELDSRRNLLLWEAAKKRGIRLYQFRVLNHPDGINFFVAYAGKKVRAFEGLPKPKRGSSKSLAWMDNKGTLKKKLLAAGIPMAQGKACLTYKDALRTFHALGGPVITKPNLGSHGRHSTVHIMTDEQLKVGFEKAKKLSPWVIVEQELQGFLFRILIVDKKMAIVTRREAAHIIGDGVHSVRMLAEQENKNVKRQGPIFHMLAFDEAADQELDRQGISWDSIPKKGEMVTLNSYISRFCGGSTTDFTERVHPDNIKLFEHLGEVLGDSLIGVDFIIGDMERSWREQKLCGVLESNSMPNIEVHHEVLFGKNYDAAGMLLDIAFPKN